MAGFFGAFKEKAVSWLGNSSGLLSVAGAHNVCHSLCLAAIGVLSLAGITLSGMPLLFLQDYAIYFWFMALGSLLLSLYIYLNHKHCAPGKLVLANAGFVVAGIPFKEMQPYGNYLLAAGSVLVLAAIALFAREKLSGKKPNA